MLGLIHLSTLIFMTSSKKDMKQDKQEPLSQKYYWRQKQSCSFLKKI